MRKDILGRFKPKFTTEEKIGFYVILAFIIYVLIAQTIYSYKNAELYAYNPILPKAEAAETEEAIDEILQKIADCESGGKQFYSDGRVVLNVNKDGSADVGWAQINLRYHGAAIARMKLDVINSEEDNKAFAKHLYQTQGVEPWKWSRHCWDK
jgi:hypothetical protein